MLESGTPAVLKIETIGSLGSAGVPESQNHELYYSLRSFSFTPSLNLLVNKKFCDVVLGLSSE